MKTLRKVAWSSSVLVAVIAVSGCEAMMYKPFAPGNVFNRDGTFLGGAQVAQSPAQQVAADCANYESKGFDASNLKPFQRLNACVSPIDRIMISQFVESAFLGVTSCLNKISELQSAMHACTDAAIGDAVSEAGQNADFKDAIKAFYVKQQTQIDALMVNGQQSRMTYRAATQAANTAAEEAFAKVQLEAKLAGQ